MKRLVPAVAIALALTPLAPAFASGVPAVVKASASAPTPAATVPYYSLNVTLQPEKQALTVSSRLRVIPQQANLKTLKLRLHSGLKVSRVTVNERPARFKRAGEALEIDLPAKLPAAKRITVGVDYAGRPQEAINGAKLQDLEADAVVLHPKGRWYPQPVESSPATADVHVRLPARWRVAGPAERMTGGGTLFHLNFTQPGPLALVAGAYQLFNADGLTTYTRPRPDAEAELREGAKLLAFYRGKGLGLGASRGTLIELPERYRALVLPGFQARPMTPGGLADWVALGQWVSPNAGTAAHIERQWLGHSLIAFTRDLLEEKAHGRLAYQQAVGEHLARYQDFVRRRAVADVPLGEAIEPDAEAWEPVVLHKGPLVWAMLRDELGDAALWKGLKHFHGQLASRQATLSLFHESLGRETDFLYSWLAHTGLPTMRFHDVAVSENEGLFQVTGRLTQAGAAFRLPLDLALVCQDGVQRVRFQSFSAEMPFHFVSRSKPLRLVLDPEERRPLVRRSELTVPEGTGPVDGVIVYGTKGTPEETQACLETARKHQENLRKYRNLYLPIRADSELTGEERKRSLLLFGRPGINSITAELENQFPVRFNQGKAIWWQGRIYQAPRHGTVQIIANPQAPSQTVVLFAAMSAEGMADTLRYTQTEATFCVFEGAEPLAEGRTLRAFPDLEAVLY